MQALESSVPTLSTNLPSMRYLQFEKLGQWGTLLSRYSTGHKLRWWSLKSSFIFRHTLHIAMKGLELITYAVTGTQTAAVGANGRLDVSQSTADMSRCRESDPADYVHAR